MDGVNLSIRSRHVVTPDGVRDAVVIVRDGRIAAIEPAHAAMAPAQVHLGDAWLLPGLVDSHVHVNEPGRTEWEGFATATAAAAAGGVTTLIDMPLNSVPATTSFDALEQKMAAAQGKLYIDAGFWGGVVPGNVRELEALAAGGVRGFKCFMVPSGVDEFAHVSEDDLREAMPVFARLDLPLLAHAELPRVIDAHAAELKKAPRRYATWLASRPPAAEVEAIRLLIRLSEETGCRVHVVHLATPEAVDDLEAARTRGVPITVETCPHYLFFAAEEIEEGATAFKCAPPIRDRGAREGLWQALLSNDIDLVASDHSPCPPDLKRADRGDFVAAWGGIASLELGLSVLWTRARELGCTPENLARWMSAAPARLAGLTHRKGAIAPGCDADFVVFDPDAEWTVDPARLHQRHRVTPYAGARLGGRVLATYLAGHLVYDGEAVAGPPKGRFVTS